MQRGKIRLAGFRAQTGEFRHPDADGVVLVSLWIIKDFQLFRRLTGHGESCSGRVAKKRDYTLKSMSIFSRAHVY